MRQVRGVLGVLPGAVHRRKATLVRYRSGGLQRVRRLRRGMPASRNRNDRGGGAMSEAAAAQRVIVCEGNEAAAIGVALARPDVVAVYPITPQSSLVEHLSQMIADGSLQTDLMNLE